MHAFRKFVWPMVAAIAIAGGSYMTGQSLFHGSPAIAAAQVKPAKPTSEIKSSESLAQANELSKAFRVVHDSLKDAVVNINVTKKPTGMSRMSIPDELRRRMPPGLDLTPPDDEELSGTGSGVIIDADGHIITNNHVVDGATEMTVRLNDGREIKATLVGTDPKTDLAVIQIKADQLTYAKFGDSDALDVGDWVLAFGSPFGFDQSMTQGIISAKGRHVPIIAQHNPLLQGLTYENFLQTDAAINPGNSGGPLVNMKGEVVGINAAIASNTGGYNGIGFSIPSNDAQYISKSLIQHGKVIRGYLGIQIGDVAHPSPKDQPTVDNLRSKGFTGNKGVLITEIKADGPAVNGTLKVNDIITAINGKNIETVDDLRNTVARIAPNDSLSLTVFRDGKSQDVTCKVGTQPDTSRPITLTSVETPKPSTLNSSDLGINVEDLDAATAKDNNLEPGKGVVINRIGARSLAAQAGLKLGDVVMRVNKTDITSAKQFMDVLGQSKLSDGVKLSVRSREGDHFVSIEKN